MAADSQNIKEVRDWLFKLQSRGWGTSLDAMCDAMHILGDPQERLTAIHVAGTNGKGSVCAMASAILKSAGMKVGLYVSPHLIDIRERITINDEEISDDRLADLSMRARDILEGDNVPVATRLTFFEFITAIGLLHFAQEGVDVAVMETGFGGRLDATNILPPSVSVITSVGLDHTEYLGNTVEAVAGEKAGIIKKGCGVVSSASDQAAMGVIRKRAHELECSLVENGRDFLSKNVRADLISTSFDYEGTRDLRGLRTNLLGRHQAENAATAIAACDVLALREGLELRDEHVRDGLLKVHWPGRLDVVSRNPLTILDCGHNPPAIGKLLGSLSDMDVSPDTVIFASSKDKDYRTSASVLFPLAKRLILTRYGAPRSIDPEVLAALPEAKDRPVFLARDISESLEISKDVTPEGETVLVIGSVFLVGDALSWLRLGRKGDFSLAGFKDEPSQRVN